MTESKHTSPMKIAYLTNVYPAPSHSFIRREILALEQRGLTIQRFTVRRTESALKDPQDKQEQLATKVLLDAGSFGLVGAMLVTFCKTPVKFVRTFLLAVRTGRRSDRGLLLNLVYLAEACYLRGRLALDKVSHLHAHFGTNSTTVALFCHHLGGPAFSFTAHGPEEFDKATVLSLSEKISEAKFVAAISSFGRSQLMRWCSYKDWPKIQIVRCGLDEMFLVRTTSPFPSNQTLVCVGRLCEQKGQLILVDALAALHARGISCNLVLVGDGPMRSEIESRIAVCNLSNHVRITGWASGDDVRREIEAAQLFVLPSFAEGLPVVIMEALALGRPVISTYVAGIPELVRPGENGWLVPAGDVDALADAIRDALATPLDRLSAMGDAGRDAVRTRHDIRSEAAKLAELFESVEGAEVS